MSVAAEFAMDATRTDGEGFSSIFLSSASAARITSMASPTCSSCTFSVSSRASLA